ncbi:FliI/YscN family ATPase [Conexibacter stalactiti]|uniref:FliI/YscN family ATPase n=1 Tax=Conexibacter stalactiti TaxID=1940611 RepID=A0ABU4HUZ5_9ACTN|nr:FliI/YscN family ATPase [Conexibacter stalactiti]MDW5597009.1 FliI/YscN family ATPase [Conexibacter stalactiti]MEC5037651.1 FliI/YscN family ATPase [Conexibacter stalactiti]
MSPEDQTPEVRVPQDVGETLAHIGTVLRHSDLARRHGRVSDLIGLVVEATGLQAEVGEICMVNGDRGHPPVPSEVVGFRGQRTLLMPLGEMHGIGPATTARATGSPFRIRVGDDLLGRVIDGLGRPIDGMPRATGGRPRSANASPPDPLERPRIDTRVDLGVRALDSLVPCGRGQRLGIFAGSGVGKSSLLGMIARSTTADVNVIALVGERGREVKEFIERDLGDALAHSVVVVATSDQPALVRIKAAFTATAIAEHFRDQGKDVMLMMDSVTRFAMAQREVGLAIGEPPATRGYTPSVFAQLPRLLERSGTAKVGSITGLYTVLVDGDDMNEPIADAVRSILDGHIVLTRELAHASHYPAIDVLQSVSRLVGEVVSPQVRAAGQAVRHLMAAYKEKEDLIAIGAYQGGTDPTVDAAIALRPQIDRFLRQHVSDATTAAQADALLLDIAARIGEFAGVGGDHFQPDPAAAAQQAEPDLADNGEPAIPGPLNL